MLFVDTHTHLYLEQFRLDRTETIERAFQKKVKYMLLPAIDSHSFEAMMKLHEDYPQHCFPMIGLHPTHVKKDVAEQLAFVEKYLDDKRFLAIGEIGIDLYWEDSFLKEQEHAFRQQLTWSMKKNLPVVIHSRESMNMIIDILEEKENQSASGIFHCFTGSLEQANRILALGDFKLGIGGVLTFKNSGLSQLVRDIDLEDIVLETDSPFLAPAPYRGKRNESAYIPIIAEHLSQIKGVDVDEIAAITTNNTGKIFKRDFNE